MGVWANLGVTLGDVAKDNAALVTELTEFDVTTTVALLSSLLTLPTQQAQCLRLELLVALALIHCKGNRVATVDDAARWHAAIGESQSASGEDPAEDVFVSLASNNQGSYRLLEGVWEGAGFYSQCMVEVVDAMSRAGIYNPLKRAVQAMLQLSDIVCARSSLARYAAGSDDTQAPLDTGHLDAPALRARMSFTDKSLREAGIAIADLAPFILDAASIPPMAGDVPGSGTLEQRPSCAPATAWWSSYPRLFPSRFAMRSSPLPLVPVTPPRSTRPWPTSMAARSFAPKSSVAVVDLRSSGSSSGEHGWPHAWYRSTSAT